MNSKYFTRFCQIYYTSYSWYIKSTMLCREEICILAYTRIYMKFPREKRIQNKNHHPDGKEILKAFTIFFGSFTTSAEFPIIDSSERLLKQTLYFLHPRFFDKTIYYSNKPSGCGLDIQGNFLI